MFIPNYKSGKHISFHLFDCFQFSKYNTNIEVNLTLKLSLFVIADIDNISQQNNLQKFQFLSNKPGMFFVYDSYKMRVKKFYH